MADAAKVAALIAEVEAAPAPSEEAAPVTSEAVPPAPEATGAASSPEAAPEKAPPKEKTPEDLQAENDAKIARGLALVEKRRAGAKPRLQPPAPPAAPTGPDAATLQRQLDELRGHLTDPISGWKKLGLDPAKTYEQVTKQILQHGTPAEQIEQLRQQGLSPLEQKIAALEKTINDQKEVAAREQATAKQRAAEQKLVALVSEADKFPTLYENHTDAEICRMAEDALVEFQQTNGRPFQGSIEDVAEFLEARAKQRAKEVEARREKRRSAGSAGKTAQQGSTASEAGGGRPERTLTNATASQRASAGPGGWSREQERARIVAELEAQDAKRRAERRAG